MENEKLKTVQIDTDNIDGDPHGKNEAPEVTPEEEQNVRILVSELREPIRKMLEPIMENIKDGGYQLLIGDDASGRIPTLIVRAIINSIYARNGRSQIPTRFIAGTRGYEVRGGYFNKKKAKVLRYIQDFLASAPDTRNALIVTDTIASGRSPQPTADSLEECGISYDIVTVGSLLDDKEKLALFSGPIFSGQHGAPSVYSSRGISGVQKRVEDLHATPLMEHLPSEDSAHAQKIINLAREEGRRVAKEILADYSVNAEDTIPSRNDFVDDEGDVNDWRLLEENKRLAAWQ